MDEKEILEELKKVCQIRANELNFYSEYKNKQKLNITKEKIWDYIIEHQKEEDSLSKFVEDVFALRIEDLLRWEYE